EPQVAHVTEHVPLRVLRARVAEVRADPHEERRALSQGVALDWKTAEQGEAAAVEELLTELGEARRHRRQREVPGAHAADALSDVTGLRQEALQRAFELRDVRV